MLVLNIIICCVVSVGVWLFMTLMHELGHVLALLLTKHFLQKDKLEFKVLVRFRKGFTTSPLYLDLIDSEQYEMIKRNSIAGYLLALSVGIIVFIVSGYALIFVKHIAPSVILVTIFVNIIIWFINLCLSIGASGDWKYFKNPELFEFIESIDKGKYTLTKDDYWLLLGLFSLSSVICLIFFF